MRFNKPIFAMAAVISGSLTSCGIASNPFTRHSSNGVSNSNTALESWLTPPSSQVTNESRSSPDSRTGEDDGIITIEVPYWCVSLAERRMEAAYDAIASEYGDFDYKIYDGDLYGVRDSFDADIVVARNDTVRRYFEYGLIDYIDDRYSLDAVDEQLKAALQFAMNDDGAIFAYPLSAYSSFALFYNKAYLTEDDVTDWASLLQKAESLDKKVYWQAMDAWYGFPLLHAFGCESKWQIDLYGNATGYYDDVAKYGLNALRYFHDICQFSSLNYVDDAGMSGDDAIAFVTGEWNMNVLSSKFGDDLAGTILPCLNGVQMNTFISSDYLAINSQSRHKDLANAIAWNLTNEPAQALYLKEHGVGNSFIPTVYSVRRDAEMSYPALSGLFAQQEQYWVNQGAYPGNWWDAMYGLLSGAINLPNPVTDEDIERLLQYYDAAIAGMLN